MDKDKTINVSENSKTKTFAKEQRSNSNLSINQKLCLSGQAVLPQKYICSKDVSMLRWFVHAMFGTSLYFAGLLASPRYTCIYTVAKKFVKLKLNYPGLYTDI